MELAIMSTLECMECGNQFEHKAILVRTGKYHKFSTDKFCNGCGNKGDKGLVDFRKMELSIYEDDETALIVPQNKADRIKEIALKEIKQNEN